MNQKWSLTYIFWFRKFICDPEVIFCERISVVDLKPEIKTKSKEKKQVFLATVLRVWRQDCDTKRTAK